MSLLYRLLFRAYRFYLKSKGSYQDFDSFYKQEVESGFIYTRLKGAVQLGYIPDLNEPSSFNEKSIHRRIYDRSPLWPIVTNKITVRDWLKEKGLDEDVRLIPILNVINDVDKFDFSNLDQQVVIKAAWASGMNIFVTEPESADWLKIKNKLLSWQKQEYAPERLVWSGTKMNRDFIIEKMYSTASSELLEDYKFYVFHGKVELIQVIVGRDDEPCYAHFDRDLNRIKVKRFGKKDINQSYSLNPIVNEMVIVAEKIGKYFDFSRVDLYDLEGEIYFGEITECPNNGYARFEPMKFDTELGRKWEYKS